MELIDNLNTLLGEDIRTNLMEGSKLKIVAAAFSIYAYEALKEELEKVSELEFIFDNPSFVPEKASDVIKKEKREFYIPRPAIERSVYGTDFEIRLKNKLTQRAVARECADWIKKKARFRSNRAERSIPPFIYIGNSAGQTAYLGAHGFTSVDLGYQKGDQWFNAISKITGQTHTAHLVENFKSLWKDSDALVDVTEKLIDHIESVYQENSPERVVRLMMRERLFVFILMQMLR